MTPGVHCHGAKLSKTREVKSKTDVELQKVEEGVNNKQQQQPSSGVQLDTGRAARVCAGVLLGDFMHNLGDGFFIGFGFMFCGDSFGWGITGATVAHEIAQELADYLVLTDPAQGGSSHEGAAAQLHIWYECFVGRHHRHCPGL